MVVARGDEEHEAGPASTLGRRERKRLETRDTIARAAIDLFAEQGFDSVTVTEIAERADVDPSTFFRHFGSKEAVIFSDYGDWQGRMATAMRGTPEDASLVDAMTIGMKRLVTELMVNVENERRRGELIEASPSVRAQSLVVREALIDELAGAVAERLGVDAEGDVRPRLVAATWILAANWYRARAVDAGKAPANPEEAIDAIHGLVQSFVELMARGR